MKPESIKTYTRRISLANKSELIVILYDIIEENLSLAEQVAEKGDREELKELISETLPFVKELLISLDMKYELSKNLASLYIYVNRCLSFASINGNINEIKTARKIMNKLSASFREVAKEDTSPPVMGNTEQLFAGMTYGKNLGLSETMVDENAGNRGFRV